MASNRLIYPISIINCFILFLISGKILLLKSTMATLKHRELSIHRNRKQFSSELNKRLKHISEKLKYIRFIMNIYMLFSENIHFYINILCVFINAQVGLFSLIEIRQPFQDCQAFHRGGGGPAPSYPRKFCPGGSAPPYPRKRQQFFKIKKLSDHHHTLHARRYGMSEQIQTYSASPSLQNQWFESKTFLPIVV